MSGKTVALIAGAALVTAAIKAAGPIAFGGRPLPESLARVVELLPPPLLAALVVTQALANGDRISIGADTFGVALAGIAAWVGASVVSSVVLAAGTAAGARLLF